MLYYTNGAADPRTEDEAAMVGSLPREFLVARGSNNCYHYHDAYYEYCFNIAIMYEYYHHWTTRSNNNSPDVSTQDSRSGGFQTAEQKLPAAESASST